MSDADRLEEVVALSLFTLLPKMQADNRTTLIYLVVGLILGRNVQLAKIAEQVNYEYKESSLEDRFRRFVSNNQIEVMVTFSIFVKLRLKSLDEDQPVVLSIDIDFLNEICRGAPLWSPHVRPAQGWPLHKSNRNTIVVNQGAIV